MEWKKPPDELVEFIAEEMKSVKCDYRKMFGYPAYFVNGYMFTGIHGDKLFLRLSDKDIEEIAKSNKDVIPFEPMPGRAMKGYIVLPKSIYSNKTLFKDLISKSVKYVSSLPPKQKK
jgi:TfoX/Sxy family transcriptional regulator of competence genes